jgi:Site-specific recombinases, DNA invertase Pin homologs
MRAASYSRVSTEEQIEGFSLSAQKRGVREYCSSKGWSEPDEFVDEGRSARTEAIDKRPGLQRLLKECQEGIYDVVVVYSLDRWSRNLMVTLQTFNALAQRGVAFASATENIDYSSPEGRLFVAMLGAFAQYFSDSLAKHTRKGIDERVHQGRPAGPIPFGYRKGEDGIPVPVKEEAEAVRLAFQMKARGKTNAEIASSLNERNFKTKEGNRFTHFAVRDLLTNPFYTGQIRFHGNIVPGGHEGVIDITLYEAVQALRTKRASAPGKRSYLLRGIVRCAQCGGTLWATSPHHGYTYYRQQAGVHECSAGEASVPCKVIDKQIEGIVTSMHLEPNWRETIIQRVVALSERERIASERRQAQDRLKRLGRAYVDGLIAERAYEAEHRQLEMRLASLAVPEVDVAVEAGALLEQIQELWREATVDERHDLLAGMIDAVYVHIPSRRVVGITPKGPFREAFRSLDGAILVPPEEADQILLWWRRRGIEPLVQKKANPNILQA